MADRETPSFGLSILPIASLLAMIMAFSAVNQISQWTEDTALAVLLKDLKAAHGKGLEHGIAMPFNALSSTLLFQSWGQTPKVG